MQDTRERLLKIAARLFADKGFAGASVRQIVQEAGANISAIRYHFGDKRGLYRAVISYLIEDLNQKIFSQINGLTPTTDAYALSEQQAWQWLHVLMDRLLDIGFSRRNRLLERIILREKLSSSSENSQLAFIEHPLLADCLLPRLVAHLTGLAENSEELMFLTTALFGQIPSFHVHRSIILRRVGVKDYTPAMREKIKLQVWRNTQAILNTYIKGKNK